MKAYISGRITGDSNYRDKFMRAYKVLVHHFDYVFNPAKVNLGDSATWNDYMRYDIKHLMDCDVIYMLKDWKKSKGARFEFKVARKLGIKVMYEGNE